MHHAAPSPVTTLMSIAAAIYYISWQGVAASITATNESTSSPCDNLHYCRTILDIIWSCAGTILLCTWVALHPNIPAPNESLWGIASHRAKLVILLLMAPELGIIWAMWQWLVARRLAKKYQNRGWQQSHGFFALMGDFALVMDGQATRILGPDELQSFSDSDRIDFPEITENEIQDRSKSDSLSKGFVVVQTGWFALQFIARHVGHLPVTGVEKITLTFAVLNITTYWFWWNKPRNVRCPVRVLAKENFGNGEAGGMEDAENGGRNHIMPVVEDRMYAVSHRRSSRPFIQMESIGDSAAIPICDVMELTDGEYLYLCIGGALIQMALMVLHCVIRWSSPLASLANRMVWSCLFIFGVFVVLFSLLQAISICIPQLHFLDACRMPPLMQRRILLSFAVFYFICRITSLVLAFIDLRSLPPGAYQKVNWTVYIPHI